MGELMGEPRKCVLERLLFGILIKWLYLTKNYVTGYLVKMVFNLSSPSTENRVAIGLNWYLSVLVCFPAVALHVLQRHDVRFDRRTVLSSLEGVRQGRTFGPNGVGLCVRE